MSVAAKLLPVSLLVSCAAFAQDPPLSGGCWATAAGGCAASTTISNVHVGTPRRPTFYKDVLPVLQAKCQSCHGPGEAGRTAFLDYKGTRPWAKAIKVVVAQRMPPSAADPHFGKFENDRHLSDDDIKTLTAWADAGAPEGDAKDAPKPKPIQ